MQDIKPSLTSIRSLTLWAFSIISAFMLNAVVLSVLPELINKNPSRPETVEDMSFINVIRVKRKEAPPRKKEIKKPRKEEKPKKKLLKALVIQKRPKKVQQKLPFKLNPKLPAGPGTLPTFPLQSAAIDLTGYKTAYGVGELDGPLTPLAKVPPIYPMNARRRGIEGWVKVKFIVTDKGVVDQIEIVEAEPSKIFDNSVVRCVSSWRFKPGTVHGEPVNTWVSTTIRFSLK